MSSVDLLLREAAPLTGDESGQSYSSANSFGCRLGSDFQPPLTRPDCTFPGFSVRWRRLTRLRHRLSCYGAIIVTPSRASTRRMLLQGAPLAV